VTCAVSVTVEGDGTLAGTGVLGVSEGMAAGLADGVGVALTAITRVRMLTLQLTVLPPGLPEPLHWLTVIGTAALIVDAEATSQLTVAPPPLAEPLHWVTVAPVVFAGYGEQFVVPPPPLPEPTHWFTVAADSGSAPGVSELMSLRIVTLHVMG
jgi:hypothetical protein